MKITDLISKGTVNLKLKSVTKLDVIEELSVMLEQAGCLYDREGFVRAVLVREEQSSTGIGGGIAIPHAKTAAVRKPAIAFGYAENGINYDSMDGKAAHFFFLIAGEDNAHTEHLETLSRLSLLLMNEECIDRLGRAKSKEEFLATIDQAERKLQDGEEVVAEKQQTEKYLLAAVTACPTGIAHTYMAAEALKKAAAMLNVAIRVETAGAVGTKNRLTDAEIEQASAIIIAADRQVETERFVGKKVLRVPVADGIKQPVLLIKRAMEGKLPLYNEQAVNEVTKEGQRWSGIYRALMSGVTDMLPLAVGGGVLNALMPLLPLNSSEGMTGIAVTWLRNIAELGGSSAFFLLPLICAVAISVSLAGKPAIAPGALGGLMASMGGAGVLGGIAAGFLSGGIIAQLKKIFTFMPEELDGLKPVLIYPLLSMLLTGLLMLLCVMTPLKNATLYLQYFAESLSVTGNVLLGALLGCLMAIDMGGPWNKAAFTFSIITVQCAVYQPAAAVMAGGMVPPLGIALATTLFKKYFSAAERKSGLLCYLKGSIFITEGAIPFVKSDPQVVLPAIVIGASLAGALTMGCGLGLPAPHGGLLLLPLVMGNTWLYLGSVLSGSMVTAVIIGFMKVKNHNKERMMK